MKRDLRGTVTAVAAFLGISASDALIDDVCRLSSFEHEERRLQVSYGENASLGEPERDDSEGRSRAALPRLLTPAQQRNIDAHFQAELRELGSTFHEFCDVSASSRPPDDQWLKRYCAHSGATRRIDRGSRRGCRTRSRRCRAAEISAAVAPVQNLVDTTLR